MTVKLAKEFHFDFGVYYITEEQAYGLLDKIVGLVEDMDTDIFMGGGCGEYTWMDMVGSKVVTFLASWRNRLNRFLGRHQHPTGRVAIGDTIYAPPTEDSVKRVDKKYSVKNCKTAEQFDITIKAQGGRVVTSNVVYTPPDSEGVRSG